MGLHGLEVLHGLDETARTGGVYTMTSTFTCPPLKAGIYSTMWGGGARADAELSLVD
jgi:hypothetical protein